MSLENIYFILVRPQLGENIGSVARAIKNFNISFAPTDVAKAF